MIKVNALDFLHNDNFPVDIFSESGELLYSAQEEITPEKILMLYFKSICVQEELLPQPTTSDVDSESTELITEQQEEIPVIVEKIGFDDAMASRVVKHSMLMADMIGLDAETKSTLEKAAYYHTIGSIEIPVDELTNPSFKKIRANASYTYLVEKLDMPEKVAKVAKTYLYNYDPTKYDLTKKSKATIPIHHIVAIASFYEEFLAETGSKEEALIKLLRLGGNKFNIYILHKFVYKMRKADA